MTVLKTIKIAGREISVNLPPYVIAELSANHNGKLETALQLISEAARAGADAVKLQTYRPDTITLNSEGKDFQIHDGLWSGKTLYELYNEAHTPWEWHAPLFEHARKLGITIFSTPFDFSAVDFLEELNAPAYKIASFELVDLPLIRYVASKGKPMILSTGMAEYKEIQDAINAARDGGCKEIAILHCVSGYPAPAAEYNLRTIEDMRTHFDTVIGLSDHTKDNTTAIVSVAFGASIIEKHLTLNRLANGPDDSFSIEPDELTLLCNGVRTAWDAIGKKFYGCKPSEYENKKFRRSLYFVKDLEIGDVITTECVRSVRPGFGLAPKYFEEIIGKKISIKVSKNTPVSFDKINFS
jgi:pseudaminic acid synthase